jgi:hypothetical protein
MIHHDLREWLDMADPHGEGKHWLTNFHIADHQLPLAGSLAHGKE